MLTPVSKLPDVGTTIFTVVSELVAKTGATNLAQGFPDFEPPAYLRERVAYHVENGHNQYAPMHGVQVLREAIAARWKNDYRIDLNPEAEVTITSGASEALFSTIMALAGVGDEVIVLDPAYDLYDPAIRMAGAKSIHVALDPDDFHIDFELLGAALTPRTRLILINSPHNPTGTILSSDDLDQLADLIEQMNCFVLSDEVYEHMVFDGRVHCSVASHARLRERSVAVFSFGKTYHATGWKVGYAIAPTALTRELRRVHQFNTFATAAPLQWALADFMLAEPEFPNSIARFYQKKRDLFVTALTESTRFESLPSAGTYFQLTRYSEISDQVDTEFMRWLANDVGVAAIPISVFYEKPPASNWIRFCFAKRDETLVQATERLARL